MDIIEKSWDAQRRIEKRFKQVGKGKYGRVMKLARKPTPDEYSKIVMITGIGIMVIGGAGFLLWLLWGAFTDILYGVI
ncbi:MAG: protein translocase SEC61 complex subunit gamma [Candidatus Thermoplasmatota archaeon]|nr:protein translocase SEC61 complex subunit gamma [Candidatus Thermoplasmatota archaeon]